MREKNRDKYFANSRLFSARRVSIHLILPVELKRIRAYLLILKLYQNLFVALFGLVAHAFVRLVGEYLNPYVLA